MTAPNDIGTLGREARGSHVSPRGQNGGQDFSPVRVERDEQRLAALRGGEPTVAYTRFDGHRRVGITPAPQVLSATGDRDGALIETLRRRDSTAAERLLETYGDRMYRLALRITGREQDAEEVVQDAFWSVVRNIDTFRGESLLGSWIYRITANAAYQKLRSAAHRRDEISLDQVLPILDDGPRHSDPTGDWSAQIVDPAIQSELRDVLTAAIDELPVNHRAVIVLHDVEGLSMAEVADALGITLATAKTTAHRARLRLRKRLGMFVSGTTSPLDMAT